MKNIKTKTIFATIIGLMLFMSINTVSFAYYTMGYVWGSSTIRYYYDSYNSSRGRTYFEIGASGWSGTDVNFISGNAGNYNILCTEVDNSNVAWDGLTNYSYSGSYFTSQTLQLNRAITNTWNSDEALKSVVIHEFGHCLGLEHDYSLGEVIMNPYTWGVNSRYGDYGISTIQADDINGANALY